LISRDLNGDGNLDYVFVTVSDTWCSATLWYQHDNLWKKKVMNLTESCGKDFESEFNQGDIAVVDPAWKNLRVGQQIMGVSTLGDK
jgi:hypothetical protein